MKPAKEIMQALRVCDESGHDCCACPYYGGIDCVKDLMMDAKELIENLLEEMYPKEEQK